MKNNFKAGFVCIVIITYNGEKWIKKCLQSLVENTDKNSKIIIIDNCSKDSTRDIVLNEFKGIEFISLGENKGYGSACNTGMELAYKAGAEFVVVLNQDVIVEPDWLEPLVQASRNYPGIGILSPFQIGYDNDTPDTNQEIICEKHKMSLPDNMKFELDIYPVRYLIGACLFLPRKTIEKVGGFDPDYFMYGEETDLCERVIHHGLFSVIVKNSTIRHNSARDSYDISSKMSKYYFRNQYLLFLKNPHADFGRKIYSYFRCVMLDITKRLWEEFVGNRKGIKFKILFVNRFIYSQISILISIGSIYKYQKLSRIGSVYIKI